MKVFFDFDGTLIDSRDRLYLLFQHLVPQSRIAFEDYWDLKRNKISNRSILEKYFNMTENDLDEFESAWMQLIEEDEWLKYDKPFFGVTDYLYNLKREKHLLYLVTARQNKSQAYKQVEFFNWTNIFNEILVTENKVEKVSLISSLLSNNEQGWTAGDTGVDIMAGKLLGLKTVAVLSGFRNRKVLLSYNPDLIVDYIHDFLPY